MKKLVLFCLVTITAQIASAGTGYVQTADAGLMISPRSELLPVLKQAAEEMGSEHRLVEDSVMVLDITSKAAGSLSGMSVHFEVRNNYLPKHVDGGTLHCEGSLDLENDKWKFEGGCHE